MTKKYYTLSDLTGLAEEEVTKLLKRSAYTRLSYDAIYAQIDQIINEILELEFHQKFSCSGFGSFAWPLLLEDYMKMSESEREEYLVYSKVYNAAAKRYNLETHQSITLVDTDHLQDFEQNLGVYAIFDTRTKQHYYPYFTGSEENAIKFFLAAYDNEEEFPVIFCHPQEFYLHKIGYWNKEVEQPIINEKWKRICSASIFVNK